MKCINVPPRYLAAVLLCVCFATSVWAAPTKRRAAVNASSSAKPTIALVPTMAEGNVAKTQLESIDRALASAAGQRIEVAATRALDKRVGSGSFAGAVRECNGERGCLSRLARMVRVEIILIPTAKANKNGGTVTTHVAGANDTFHRVAFTFATAADLNTAITKNADALFSSRKELSEEPALDSLAALPLEPLETPTVTPPAVAKEEASPTPAVAKAEAQPTPPVTHEETPPTPPAAKAEAPPTPVIVKTEPPPTPPAAPPEVKDDAFKKGKGKGAPPRVVTESSPPVEEPEYMSPVELQSTTLSTTQVTAPPPRESSIGWRTYTGIGVAAVGAAAAIYGIVEYRQAGARVDEINKDAVENRQTRKEQESDPMYNRSQIAGWGVGVPLLVIGAGLITWDLAFVDHHSSAAPESDNHLTLSIIPSPSGGAYGSAVFTW